MVPILLVNLLIAMMRHTYVVTTTLKREWLRQVKQLINIKPTYGTKKVRRKYGVFHELRIY